MPKTPDQSVTISVRLTRDMVARLEKLAPYYTVGAPTPSRAVALRVALEKGVPLMERAVRRRQKHRP